jgi:hypothetical protein
VKDLVQSGLVNVPDDCDVARIVGRRAGTALPPVCQGISLHETLDRLRRNTSCQHHQKLQVEQSLIRKQLSDAELEDDDSASADDEGKLLECNSSFLVDDFGGDFDYRRVFDEKNVETEYGRNKREEFEYL